MVRLTSQSVTPVYDAIRISLVEIQKKEARFSPGLILCFGFSLDLALALQENQDALL